MEIVQEFSNQFMLYIPIAFVIVGAVLVFAFGFKSTEQPAFHNLTNDEKKSLGKKKKIKEKKSTANGHVPSGDIKSEKSPKKSVSKDVEKQEKKEKKVESKPNEKTKKPDPKAKAANEDAKAKKSVKKVVAEKPTDFDDGDWEMVPTKSEKKKKVEQSPTNKDKKPKKAEKVNQAEVEKLLKEIVNKETQAEDIENSKENVVVSVTSKAEKVVAEEPAIVEEKKDKKKKEKKPKKDVDNVNIQVSKQETEAVSEPAKVDVQVEDQNDKKPVEKPSASAPVFDELGDTWTEAKVAKKSKKKARRDN